MLSNLVTINTILLINPYSCQMVIFWRAALPVVTLRNVVSVKKISGWLDSTRETKRLLFLLFNTNGDTESNPVHNKPLPLQKLKNVEENKIKWGKSDELQYKPFEFNHLLLSYDYSYSDYSGFDPLKYSPGE